MELKVRAVDPVTQEIIQGKLLSMVDEMGIVMSSASAMTLRPATCW